MTNITWLHLSDWHQKESYQNRYVRDALIEDIQARRHIDPGLARVDFVVFSGDLTFSGQPAEYKKARQELLDPLLKSLDLPPERLFLVPGNHDFDRGAIKYLPSSLTKPLSSRDEINQWLTDPYGRDSFLRPFKSYRGFVSQYTGQPSPDYASTCIWTCGNKRVALLGLNSAWMCSRRKDAMENFDDYGFLVLGERQVKKALGEVSDADVLIAVLHHPLDWLWPFDRESVEPLMNKEFHFILHGHVHQSALDIRQSGINDCVVIPAGASYNRRTTDASRYINSYNWVQLDFETGKAVVYLRRWNDQCKQWAADIDAYPDGSYVLGSLPKNLGGMMPYSPSSTTLFMPDAHRLAQVEEKYRRLLLETCNSISLVGSPELYRYTAKRELTLRDLYIPLHAWVETRIGKKVKDYIGQVGGQFADPEICHALIHQGVIDNAGVEMPKRERVAIGERLTQSRHLVILGDPGAGKTTLIRWIATVYLLRHKNALELKTFPAAQTLPEADYLPIIVRCRDLDATCVSGTLEDILNCTLRKIELSRDEIADLVSLLRARLEAGTALLMLDGLDEITDPMARICFCEQVEKIAEICKSPIIVTSRIVGYREMGRRLHAFEHLTLADLTLQEKDNFVYRWCKITTSLERPQKVAEEFIRELRSSDRIERLTGNPMLLTAMVLVKRKADRLPSRRTDLYWEAVQVLLNWRSEIDQPLDSREALPQLEYLAYAMCDLGVQQLRQDKVLTLLRQMREEYPYIYDVRTRSPEEFLLHLEARTGILIESDRMYQFRYRVLQEYLAARALVDGRFPGYNPKKSLATYLAPLAGRTVKIQSGEHTSREVTVVESWREVLSLCLTICNDHDVDPSLRAILTPLPEEPPETIRVRAIQAALCLTDEPNARDTMVKKVMRVLAAQVGENDGSGIIRTGLVQVAMELATTRWAEMLYDALLAEFRKSTVDRRTSLCNVVSMVAGAEAPKSGADISPCLDEQRSNP